MDITVFFRGSVLGRDSGARGAVYYATDAVDALEALTRSGQAAAARRFGETQWAWATDATGLVASGVSPSVAAELYPARAPRRKVSRRQRTAELSLPRLLRFLVAAAERGEATVATVDVVAALGDAWAVRSRATHGELWRRLASAGVEVTAPPPPPNHRASQFGRARGVSFDRRTAARLVEVATSRAVPVASIVRCAVARYLAAD